MRRYSSARNAIEANRERWGLGDTEQSQSVPTGEGPSIGRHPLPLTGREAPAPYSLPLPMLRDRPLWDPPQPAQSGSVDYAARQRSQLEDVPKGGQAEPISVYPAWESRLEGMRDFLAVTSYVAYDPIVATPGTLLLTPYNVPQGYTAFWKRFRFFFDPVPGGLTPSNTLITLLVDGLIVPDYFNLPLGPLMTADQDTFVIAAEGRQLQIRVDILANVGNINTGVTVPFALLYGNVRPRTGESERRDVGVRQPPPRPQQVVVVPPPPSAAPPPAAAPAPVQRTPPFQIEAVRMLSAAGSSGGPKARLVVNERGKQRLPTAQELVQYAEFFEAVKRTQPANVRWI